MVGFAFGAAPSHVDPYQGDVWVRSEMSCFSPYPHHRVRTLVLTSGHRGALGGCSAMGRTQVEHQRALVRVLLVEDQRTLAEALMIAIDAQPDMECVGAGESAE